MLRKRPDCIVESRFEFTREYPNAICRLIAPKHYQITCFSSLLSALACVLAYIVNRRHLFLNQEISIPEISADPKLEYPWGFESVTSRKVLTRLNRQIKAWREIRAAGGLLFDYMYLSALEFILHHEYGHIVLGHLDYYASKSRTDKVLYAEVPDQHQDAFDAERVYCEAKADQYAVNAAILETITDLAPKSLQPILIKHGIVWKEAPYAIKFVCHMIVLWILSMSSIILNAHSFDASTTFKSWSSYPSIFYRFYAYKHFVLSTPMRHSHPRAQLMESIWNNVEDILVKIASFNQWLGIIVHGLSEVSTDFDVPPDADSHSDKIHRFRWFADELRFNPP
jgi:hypothetical protein